MSTVRPPRCCSLVLLAVGALLPGQASEPGQDQTLRSAPAAPWQPPPSPFVFDDFLLAPLRIHLLSAKEVPPWNTTLTGQDIARILGKLNGIWAQAGIHFHLESLVREEALNQENYQELRRQRGLDWALSLRPSASRASNVFHIYYLKRFPVNGVYLGPAMFVQDSASLRPVEGGIDEPLPRVSSHELGHALSLPHRQDVTNLMASGTTGAWLSEAEIAQARAAAKRRVWIEPAPAVFQRAEAAHQARELRSANALYRKLAGLPLNSKEVKQAKERLGRPGGAPGD